MNLPGRIDFEDGPFESGQAKAQGRVRWLGLAVALAGGLCVWGVILGILLVVPEETKAPAGSDETAAFPADPAEREQRARAVWQRFVEAPDLAARIAEVKDPERVAPLMRDYHVDRGHPFPDMGRVVEASFGTGGARQVVLFAVEPQAGPEYAVALEWTGERFAVDWEALTGYGTMDWYELLETRPDEPQLMRVFLSPVPERWQDPRLPEDSAEFLMTDRDRPDAAVLRVRPSQATVMRRLVNGRTTPARVKVRGIEGSRALELVEPRWSE